MHPIGIYIKGVLRGVLGIYIKGVLRGRTCSTFSVIGYRLTVPLRLQNQSARRAHVSPFRAVSGDLYSLSVFFARSRFGTASAQKAPRGTPTVGRHVLAEFLLGAEGNVPVRAIPKRFP